MYKGNWNQWRNRLSFRIIQGTWCLAAFVLLNAYSSTIISYLTAPKLTPVTKTIKELATGSPQNIKLLTEIDGAMAAICLVICVLFGVQGILFFICIPFNSYADGK